ncbi:MAG: hypothetical protein Q4B85_07330 [Lachnospiraceae bacterium]|nr:hypothetical protein [Lachnospiraceae bacterium]
MEKHDNRYSDSIMDRIWLEMVEAAKAVQNERKISDYVEAGGVAAAIYLSGSPISD